MTKQKAVNKKQRGLKAINVLKCKQKNVKMKADLGHNLV